MSTSACRLGSQNQANACTKHGVAVACRCVVDHWRSCWLAGWLHLWCYRRVIARRTRFSVVSNGLEIIQDEPDSAELVGCGSASHVRGFGLCRVGNAVSAVIDSWTIRSTGCSGGHAGETSSMCYRLQELVRSSVSCGKPVNAARQTISHRCADHSRVREGDMLCDTLGTHWTTSGRRSHER